MHASPPSSSKARQVPCCRNPTLADLSINFPRSGQCGCLLPKTLKCTKGVVKWHERDHRSLRTAWTVEGTREDCSKMSWIMLSRKSMLGKSQTRGSSHSISRHLGTTSYSHDHYYYPIERSNRLPTCETSLGSQRKARSSPVAVLNGL